MELKELKKSLIKFQQNPTQAGMSVMRADIGESLIRKEIDVKTKDALLKQLYASATMAGLFVLNIKNMEAILTEVEKEEEDEESYEESYSYSYDTEEESEDEDEEPEQSYTEN